MKKMSNTKKEILGGLAGIALGVVLLLINSIFF